ncbi:MAG: membrane protein insertase YidC [Acidobacteriota bacterium]|nr:membrane protein insertase YidC [Acidobacteriota bacterium]
MEKRLVLFLMLSAAIFFGWSYLYTKFYPPVPEVPQEQAASIANPSVSPLPTATTVAEPAPVQTANPSPVAPTIQVELRQFKVKTDFWTASLSNQGGVITEWVMTHFPDGKTIDAPTGVTLMSQQLTQQIGGPFRFHIPSDSGLEQTLNSAVFEIKSGVEQEIFLPRNEKREVTFFYSGNGIEASKTLIFKGAGFENSSGFDFDFRANVTRNGQPIQAFVVIGPSFGDQGVKETSIYKHAPQISYAVGTDVERETADSLKLPATPISAPVTWAAVDDNYFAMAIVPSKPVPAIRLLNDKKVSMAVQVNHGENNRVYAGPKDLELLKTVSTNFGLANNGTQLEDIVSYNWLNFLKVILKPIAQFMLMALRAINTLTHNFGWSIVVLTVLLNMLFFPLRWKSSQSMKRAALMQPKMKELQEKMKKLDKNDPRMLDLQKEQIALMKEGNPLMGCLPLLLQMPFFMAVFTVLTVSIEVRNAPFFGWVKDLSVADPVHVLPIMMCITMIAQSALTPSPANADPVQKKIQYIMPPILTYFFFWSAPAGLVLYWMVTNLVGVAQQFIINKLSPPPAPESSSKNDQSLQPPAKGKKAKQALANS